MNKLFFTITAIIILNIFPLVFKPQLIVDYKIIIVIIEGLCIWLTQPGFSISETKENQKTDRLSILFILLASSLSVVSAEIEWAYFNITLVQPSFLFFCGIGMIIIGISLRVWAIYSLGKHFTATVRINKEHQLIQSGPYAIIRHPSYTGAFLAITGVSFLLNAKMSIFISVTIMFIVYYMRIKSEEKLLISYFGNRYEDYAKNKKKLFPYVW